MLAGFDELDRLAKLESGALDMDLGNADHSAVIASVAERLGTILIPRNAGFEIDLADNIRMLASLAASLAPGEKVDLTLVGDRQTSWLEITLPADLAHNDDIFAGSTRKAQGAASAGAFGPALALRLARAEARAAGGELARVGTRLVLTLPRLTDGETEPSQDSQTGRAAQSS